MNEVAISVVLKDGAGTVLIRMDRPYLPLVGRTDRDQYPMLGHVDPYGNTIFNRGQMATLVAELERVSKAGPQGERSAVAKELVAICVEGQRKPHRFLWFIGD
ncbi:hypothetical protein ACQPZF_11205 [Actinosynnema sp. CS-041913]|uniref:hypothetical protein n=1 Tax=Actinosynnema sp. CS-041913 TaxID=3239917 RepID=UPI003D8EE3EF